MTWLQPKYFSISTYTAAIAFECIWKVTHLYLKITFTEFPNQPTTQTDFFKVINQKVKAWNKKKGYVKHMGKGCHFMSLLILHTFFIWVHGTSAMFLIKLAIFLFSDLLVFMSEILMKLDAELFK